MKTLILWISAVLHFLAATFCACSVKPDYSNQIEMMFAAFALFVGALIDAWIAIGLSEKQKDDGPKYVNSRIPPVYRNSIPMPPIKPARKQKTKDPSLLEAMKKTSVELEQFEDAFCKLSESIRKETDR